jgi:hypothetical protein
MAGEFSDRARRARRGLAGYYKAVVQSSRTGDWDGGELRWALRQWLQAWFRLDGFNGA